MKKWFLIPLGLLALAIATLVALPNPIDAVAYTPPIAPALIGEYAPNQKLDQASLLGRGQILGAEDIDVDASGRIVGATADGRILRLDKNGTIEVLADTKGRPLGLDWDPDGNLIICDAFKGLLKLTPDGQLITLLTEVDGIPLGFPDDLEISKDGTIYFSDASTKYDQKHYRLDMFEARPWGRLIRFDPRTQTATTLLKDLYFANGIALSKDESFVLINETYRYRVSRYWLTGPKAGEHDIFIDNLPGFPDGISSSGRGTFWLALPTTRNAQMDSLHPLPALKNLVAKLPEALQPKPKAYGFVLELNEDGEVIRNLQDSDGDTYPLVTSAQERYGILYLGSLYGTSIGRFNL